MMPVGILYHELHADARDSVKEDENPYFGDVETIIGNERDILTWCGSKYRHATSILDANSNSLPSETAGEQHQSNHSHASERNRSMESVVSNITTPPRPVHVGLRLVRDFIAFLLRGGLSTIMFCLDQFLAVFVILLEIVLGERGASFLTYPARAVMWLYQLFIWVVYTSMELFFYLPWKLLAVYAIVMFIIYWNLPEPAWKVVSSIRWTVHTMIKILEVIILKWAAATDEKDNELPQETPNDL